MSSVDKQGTVIRILLFTFIPFKGPTQMIRISSIGRIVLADISPPVASFMLG